MRTISYLIFLTLTFPGLGIAAPVSDIPEYIAPAQQAVLRAWLSTHPEYRVALDKDCNCADDIASMRKGSGGVWKARPHYHPYYAEGDFNGDKKTDFAVVLIKSSDNGKHFLTIFNGPYAIGSQPAYLSAVGGALFFGAPRPKPYRLLVGEFESEGAILEPKGATYELVGGDCC